MCPFVDDLDNADALPEQPPEGAMSFNEFVRTRSNDPEMNTIEAMINHMIAGELRVQANRERLYLEIQSGRKAFGPACSELFTTERNASCQRVGFLLGHATAFRMDSEVLRRAQTFFAGEGPFTQVPDAAATGNNGQAHAASTMPMSNGVARPNAHTQAENPPLTNGMDHEATTNGDGVANGEASSANAHETMTPDSNTPTAESQTQASLWSNE